MKKKFIVFAIFFVILLLNSCNSQSKYDIAKCEENHIKALQFMNDYFFSNETNKFYLDSAEVYLYYVIHNCEYNDITIMHELQLLAYKREYQKALSIIDTNKWKMDSISASYFIPVLKKRFEAMQLLFNGDTLSCNDTIKSIILGLDKYLSPYKKEIEFVLTASEEEAIKSIFWYPITLCYYYKSILCSQEEFEQKIIEMKKAGFNEMIIDIFKISHEENFNFLNYEIF
jgi:hypothetical protein